MMYRLSQPLVMIALGLAIFTGVGAYGTRAMASTKGAPSGSRPLKEYSLVVSLPREVFRPGEPIKASIEFRNLAGPEVTIWISGFWPNHKVVVKDEAGVEPPLTDLGKRGRQAFSPGGGRDKNYPHIVKRGGKYSIAANANIAELYDLTPGKYRLEVTYDDEQGPTPLRITSSSVEFQVK